jgi:hypothetical protein
MLSEYKLVIFEFGLLVTFVCWMLIHVVEDLGRFVRVALSEWVKIRRTLNHKIVKLQQSSIQSEAQRTATGSAKRLIADLFRL